MSYEDEKLIEDCFEVATLWWTLASTSTSEKAALPETRNPQLNAKAKLYKHHSARRAKMVVADLSAAAVAKKDLFSSRLLTAARAWISDRLYSTVGYVGDLIGAAMAYRPNWSRVPRVPFGVDMRHTHFFLPDDIVMLNSVAVPCLARPVARSRSEWADRIQLDTVQWRFKAKSLRLSQITDKICQKVRSRPSDSSIVPSFADASATVLRSNSWVPSDRVLVVNHSHFVESVMPQLSQISALSGVEVIIVHLDLLSDTDEVAEKLRRALWRITPRMAIIPHVLDDGQVVNVSQAVSDCTAASCISIIDGSYAVGNVDVDISAINADVYISRLDVFCFCYPGTSLIVTSAGRHNCLQTLTVSYFHGKGYDEEWRYYGHSDHSLWLCAFQAFQFQKFICFDYEDYCGRLSKKAMFFLCDAWGVSPFRHSNGHVREQGFVFTVPFPPILGASENDARRIREALDNWGIYVGIVTFDIGKDGLKLIACRVTCNVFNTVEEIQRLAAAVCALADMRINA